MSANTGSTLTPGTDVSLALAHRPTHELRGVVAYADTLGIALRDGATVTFYPWSAVLSARTEGK